LKTWLLLDTVTSVEGAVKPLDPQERAFQLISGHRALDFLATLLDRHRQPTESLREPADLDRWLALAGFSVAAQATRADLRHARQLREVVNRLTRAALAGQPPAAGDLDALNDWARREPLAPQADPKLGRRWSAARPIQASLALIAREAVDLLTGPDRALIRECAAAPNCSRLYLDRSRAHRRRWCHMQRCGSRAKMTAYRQRQQTLTRPSDDRL
jgi:predicted RNA-binding Zn ribbon-like protein